MSTFLYVLLAILLLGILIAIHEFGHFATARLTKIPVKEFAIGMGPKVFSRVSKKSGIRYSLRAIPMGGYCAFVGEDDPDKKSHNDPRAFSNQKLWKRMLTVLMGPGMNFILAFVVLFFYFWIGGMEAPKAGSLYQPYIGGVVTNGEADFSGIRAGDFIQSVNGVDISVTEEERWSDSFDTDAMLFSTSIRNWKDGDDPIRLTIRRGEEVLGL